MTETAVPARRVVSLAASAFIVLAAEPIFLLVDTAVVGHLGRVPLAALGAAGVIMTFLAIIGTSLEYGTTGRAARYFGAGQRAAAVNEGVQATWLAVLIGAIGIALGEAIAHPVSRFVTGSGHADVGSAAESWLRIAVLGLPAILIVLAANGWLRGVQDTRTPVRIVVVANVVSAAASPLLVYPFGLGLEGSALANVIGQWLGALLCVEAIRREHAVARPDWLVMRRQLVVSRDLVVRSLGFQLSYLTAASAAGRMGAAVLAAHQIGLQLWTFIALLLDSFAIAAQSLVGAALGGGDVNTAKHTALRVSRYGLVAGIVFGLVMAAGWFVVPVLFTSDNAVQHQAHLLWPWLVCLMPVAGVVFALDGVLLGAGDNTFMALITVIAAVGGFIPLSLAALHFHWGITGIWAGLGLFMTIRFAGMALRTWRGRWLVVGAEL